MLGTEAAQTGMEIDTELCFVDNNKVEQQLNQHCIEDNNQYVRQPPTTSLLLPHKAVRDPRFPVVVKEHQVVGNETEADKVSEVGSKVV
ncbi:MAG: hypothetical protein MJA30_25140 [Cytophagales bacterium]|nr:hypothetical protein [Cytophagales bacterium]